MVGFFTTEENIKIKHFRRRAHLNGKTRMFLATVADGQTAASHGAKGKHANIHPESAFGWVLIGWALGRSLMCFGAAKKLQRPWQVSICFPVRFCFGQPWIQTSRFENLKSYRIAASMRLSNCRMSFDLRVACSLQISWIVLNMAEHLLSHFQPKSAACFKIRYISSHFQPHVTTQIEASQAKSCLCQQVWLSVDRFGGCGWKLLVLQAKSKWFEAHVSLVVSQSHVISMLAAVGQEPGTCCITPYPCVLATLLTKWWTSI